jgi:hypothetical protein
MRHCCSAQALWQKRDPAVAGRRRSQCRAPKAVAAAGSADTRRRAIWRRHPVVAIEIQANNLRRLRALYIDCGEKDQFNLLYGARRFVRRLNELGIAHRYEEFPDNHTGVDYRMDESLPFLAQALSG